MATLADENPEEFAELNERFQEDSNGWRWLPASDPARGEAEATVSAVLPECATCKFGIENQADSLVLGALAVGGTAGLPEGTPRWEDRKRKRMKARHQCTS